MNEEQSKAVMGVLEGQRNAALNALVHAEANLVLAQTEIKRLQEAVAKHQAADTIATAKAA